MQCTPLRRVQQTALACGSTVHGNTVTGVHAVGNLSREHVYNLTLMRPTAITFDACNSSYDVSLRVFAARTQREVAYRDDGGCPADVPSNRVRLTTVLHPGEYEVVIEGWGTDEGEYWLTVHCLELTTWAPTVATPPAVVSTAAGSSTARTAGVSLTATATASTAQRESTSRPLSSTHVPPSGRPTGSTPTPNPSATLASATPMPTVVPTWSPTAELADLPGDSGSALLPTAQPRESTFAPSGAFSPFSSVGSPTPQPSNTPTTAVPSGSGVTTIAPTATTTPVDRAAASPATSRDATVLVTSLTLAALAVLSIVVMVVWSVRKRKDAFNPADLPMNMAQDLLSKQAAADKFRDHAYSNPVYGHSQYAGYLDVEGEEDH
mmetsp:Transcript_4525/g.13711  ORF Transcript_4525/g.13711 Transcript_4525/m.13711 type:complete len:379 (+) Transcript_4525:330-1466(+)